MRPLRGVNLQFDRSSSSASGDSSDESSDTPRKTKKPRSRERSSAASNGNGSGSASRPSTATSRRTTRNSEARKRAASREESDDDDDGDDPNANDDEEWDPNDNDDASGPSSPSTPTSSRTTNSDESIMSNGIPLVWKPSTKSARRRTTRHSEGSSTAAQFVEALADHAKKDRRATRRPPPSAPRPKTRQSGSATTAKRMVNGRGKRRIKSLPARVSEDSPAAPTEEDPKTLVRKYAFLFQYGDFIYDFLRPDVKVRIDPYLDEIRIERSKRLKAVREASSVRFSPVKKPPRAATHMQDLDSSTHESSITSYTETPPFVNGVMRPYQIFGINWLISMYERDLNGILADEMGLGKTLQSLSFLGYLKHVKKFAGPFLVVAPLSTLTNWHSEVRKWLPSMTSMVLAGTAQEREELLKMHIKSPSEIVVTSYQILNIHRTWFRRRTWRYLIVDEAQSIKNDQGLLAKNLRALDARHRLLLTGTPLQNNLKELWSLLSFLIPDMFAFDSTEAFEEYFGGDSKEQPEEPLAATARPQRDSEPVVLDGNDELLKPEIGGEKETRDVEMKSTEKALSESRPAPDDPKSEPIKPNGDDKSLPQQPQANGEAVKPQAAEDSGVTVNGDGEPKDKDVFVEDTENESKANGNVTDQANGTQEAQEQSTRAKVSPPVTPVKSNAKVANSQTPFKTLTLAGALQDDANAQKVHELQRVGDVAIKMSTISSAREVRILLLTSGFHEQMIRPFLLRRLKSDQEKGLLPKKRIDLKVPLSDMQRTWYKKILLKHSDEITKRRVSSVAFRNIAMQLRKCCCHPYLFEGAEPGPPYTTDKHVVDNSGK